MRNILFIVLTSLATWSFAQQKGDLSFSLMDESIAFPLTRLTPLHPGAEIGYTLYVKGEGNVQTFNIYLGGYHHEQVENGFYLRAEQGHHFRVIDNVTTDLFYGLGYLHTFYPGELYEINPDTGEFEKASQLGRPHVLASVGVGFTWVNDSFIEPFVRQDLTLESPFANGIPVIIHSFLKVGLTFKLQSI